VNVERQGCFQTGFNDLFSEVCARARFTRKITSIRLVSRNACNAPHDVMKELVSLAEWYLLGEEPPLREGEETAVWTYSKHFR
jgi:hypothetical protein